MKNLLIILCVLTFIILVSHNAQAQSINGDATVCSDETVYYLAVEGGGVTFRKWLGVNSILASGYTEYDQEIQIEWDNYSGTNFFLAWTGFFYPGGELEVEITQLDTPEILTGSCELGSGTGTFKCETLDGATNYKFYITGFGLTSPIEPSDSEGEVTVSLPNTSLPGSVKAKAYFAGGCNKWWSYGGTAYWPM